MRMLVLPVIVFIVLQVFILMPCVQVRRVLLLLSPIALLGVMAALIVLELAIDVRALVLLTCVLMVHHVARGWTGVYFLVSILGLLVVVTDIIRIVIVAVVALLSPLCR